MCQHSNINGEICLLWDNFSYKGIVQKKTNLWSMLKPTTYLKLWLHKTLKTVNTEELHRIYTSELP